MDYSTRLQTPSQNNIYEKVTKQIIQSMVRSGQIPWRQTWVTKENKPMFYNPITKTKYKLLNRLLLGEPGEYVSFKQAKDHGGKIKPGSKGKLVTYWSDFIPAKDKKLKEELEAKGEDWSYLKKWTLKHYYVFNLNDIEGFKLKSKNETPDFGETVESENPVDLADLIADGYRTDNGVKLEISGVLAPGYNPDEDLVTMPQKENFMYEEDFYASLFEQFAHSTAREDRCNRKKEYEALKENEITNKESLISDICSSMILASAGIDRKESTDQLNAQIQKWVEAMENDFRLIISASRKAEDAAELIMGKYNPN